jgi:hypothetical protein
MSALPSVRSSVRLSVGVEQLDSHWTDFDEILYLGFFRKPVKKLGLIKIRLE